MPTLIDKNLMRQIIMDHYNNPLYKSKPKKNGYKSIHVKSINCIDDIYVYLNLKNNKIVDCLWNGVACAITSASTDIMCGLVINKSIEEVLNIISEYLKMIYEKKFNEKILKEALAFMNVSKQAARIKCAIIGCNAIKSILLRNKNE
ncbi:SUF system NifU family Fe-S cluster assembly protein [bacterium]|nr:SUF system NifU family Fe-S cluster assembly protein [bacterium]